MSEIRSHSDTSGAEPASAEEQTLERLLADAQARLEQQKEAWMRAAADADNARKRARADVEAAHKFAIERFAESLLPVIDSMEAALQSKDVSGVEITCRQLKSALEKVSVQEIGAAPGGRFDPNWHQAMAVVESAAEPNTIVEVMAKGYRLHDRVLRPALVTVAKALENKGGNPISEGTTNPN
ncbi:MAG: nucleotide exchange factor GrpE [Burkholderiales bacterium]|nr:nucleotide exchange factor GrpE [Burkholderiales bacterium]